MLQHQYTVKLTMLSDTDIVLVVMTKNKLKKLFRMEALIVYLLFLKYSLFIPNTY